MKKVKGKTVAELQAEVEALRKELSKYESKTEHPLTEIMSKAVPAVGPAILVAPLASGHSGVFRVLQDADNYWLELCNDEGTGTLWVPLDITSKSVTCTPYEALRNARVLSDLQLGATLIGDDGDDVEDDELDTCEERCSADTEEEDDENLEAAFEDFLKYILSCHGPGKHAVRCVRRF